MHLIEIELSVHSVLRTSLYYHDLSPSTVFRIIAILFMPMVLPHVTQSVTTLGKTSVTVKALEGFQLEMHCSYVQMHVGKLSVAVGARAGRLVPGILCCSLKDLVESDVMECKVTSSPDYVCITHGVWSNNNGTWIS